MLMFGRLVIGGALLALPVQVIAAQEQAPQEAQKAEEGQKDNTLRKAEGIATQPVRDVGISKKKVPPVLNEAVKGPYDPPKGKKCAGIVSEITELNEALGPDFGQSVEENENRAGKIAEAGGQMIINSLIPFRGLVREISGAAPAERRLQAAISAGIARRGYLRGLASARHCKLPDPPPVVKPVKEEKKAMEESAR
jgi:hypothetical protein